MKKILTYVLACVMLTSVFAVNVFAAGTDHIVGDQSAGSGVPSFGSTSRPDQSIKVTVNEVTHTYAVDIDYTNEVIELPELIWDVADLEYVVKDGEIDLATFKTKDFVVTVTNYSDQKVDASVAFVDVKTGVNEDGITFSATQDSVVGDISGTGAYENSTVKATIDAAEISTEKVATFTIDMDCDDLYVPTNYYAGKEDVGTNLVAATYTITVSIPAQN